MLSSETGGRTEFVLSGLSALLACSFSPSKHEMLPSGETEHPSTSVSSSPFSLGRDEVLKEHPGSIRGMHRSCWSWFIWVSSVGFVVEERGEGPDGEDGFEPAGRLHAVSGAINRKTQMGIEMMRLHICLLLIYSSFANALLLSQQVTTFDYLLTYKRSRIVRGGVKKEEASCQNKWVAGAPCCRWGCRGGVVSLVVRVLRAHDFSLR
ncbi:hypothetical protein D6779_03565 [Candidatus Parcubacteria bacterium]|nr:MAG: hypothetical protein D6779_03565 [Candidatus Parcubacteria bacterium]